jgi:hypothetical protein
VFFGAAMLDYRLYHSYFPAWALARYARKMAAQTDALGGLNNGTLKITVSEVAGDDRPLHHKTGNQL